MPAAEVHPSAVVHPDARLGDGVRVGPFTTIEADVQIGDRSVVEPGTVVYGGTRIGTDCRLGPHAVLGAPPQDRGYAGEASLLIVGDGVEVREFATLHRASGAANATRIGRGCLLMCYSHVGHNAQLDEHCVVTNGSQLGGHVHVGARAVLGASVEVHQFARIGAYAMVGGKSGVSQDILPYSTASGMPARHYRLNTIGLERAGFDAERRRPIEGALRALRRRDRDLVDALAVESADVANLVTFLDDSRRGVARFVR